MPCSPECMELWQGQLVNSAAILALYQHHLANQSEVGGSHLAVEVQQVSVPCSPGAYVNRQGGLGSPHLCRLAPTVWEWAHPQLKSLRGMHMPGQVNLAADQLSRGGTLPGEWGLHPEDESEIWGHLGTAIADLSSRETAHCPLFYSYRKRQSSLGYRYDGTSVATGHPMPSLPSSSCTHSYRESRWKS